MRFILEWYRPDTWGKHPKRNAPREGGVLVIGGDVTKKPEYNTGASVQARKWKAGSRKNSGGKRLVFLEIFGLHYRVRDRPRIANNEEARVTIAEALFIR